MNQEQLSVLETRLDENLSEMFGIEITYTEGTNLNKWNRGRIWKEIRPLFPSDKQFGEWRKSYIGRATKVKIDPANESKYMLCTLRMSKDQFMKIGATNARTLMSPTKAWYMYPVAIANLIETFEGSTRDFNIAWKAIKAAGPEPGAEEAYKQMLAEEKAAKKKM